MRSKILKMVALKTHFILLVHFVHECIHATYECVEVRGQLAGISSFLPPRGPQGFNSVIRVDGWHLYLLGLNTGSEIKF